MRAFRFQAFQLLFRLYLVLFCVLIFDLCLGVLTPQHKSLSFWEGIWCTVGTHVPPVCSTLLPFVDSLCVGGVQSYGESWSSVRAAHKWRAHCLCLLPPQGFHPRILISTFARARVALVLFSFVASVNIGSSTHFTYLCLSVSN